MIHVAFSQQKSVDLVSESDYSRIKANPFSPKLKWRIYSRFNGPKKRKKKNNRAFIRDSVSRLTVSDFGEILKRLAKFDHFCYFLNV